jgi:hypothetical protein
MSQVFGDMNKFLEIAAKEAKGKQFNINEFKDILTEFKLIDNPNEIKEIEQLVDVREHFGEPDLVFKPTIDVPVMIAIHKDKFIYEIASLMPNPNKNSDKPYVYAIQSGILFDKDKEDLRRINEMISRYKNFSGKERAS